MKMRQLASSAGLDTAGVAIRGIFAKDVRWEATVWEGVAQAVGGVGGLCVFPAATNRDATTTTFAAGYTDTFPRNVQFQFLSPAVDIRANFTNDEENTRSCRLNAYLLTCSL
jgi:hypothetical protein